VLVVETDTRLVQDILLGVCDVGRREEEEVFNEKLIHRRVFCF